MSSSWFSRYAGSAALEKEIAQTYGYAPCDETTTVTKNINPFDCPINATNTVQTFSVTSMQMTEEMAILIAEERVLKEQAKIAVREIQSMKQRLDEE